MDEVAQFMDELFLTSPNPWHSGQRLAEKTKALRKSVWAILVPLQKPVTVRQAFYQCSVHGAVDKTEAGYGRVQRQILAMRREGIIPYDWIADSCRWVMKQTSYTGLSDFLQRSSRFYRQNLWLNTDAYLEFWVEKDAMASVLYDVTSEFDVPLYVARGYSSDSFCHESAQAMIRAEKPSFVFYLGDLDPSGWHMSIDLEKRLLGFYPDVTFTRLAVNIDQVEKWNLPSRPTKRSDTRHRMFVQEFGDIESVELDAVHPDTLKQLVRTEIEKYINQDELQRLRLEEEVARESLEAIAERI